MQDKLVRFIRPFKICFYKEQLEIMEVNKVEVHQGKIRIQIMKKDMFKR